MSSGRKSTEARLAELALAGAIGTAACALPPAQIPWPWLLGHALPAVVALAVPRVLPRPRWAAFALAALCLLGATSVLRATVPAADAAPIASTLAAPLAWFALRRGPGDRRHALFLALCLLVIGSVLDGERARPLAVAFALCGATMLVLEHDASARTAGRVAAAAARWRRLRHRSAAVVLCVLTAACLFELLQLAPVPERLRPPAAPEPGPAAPRRTHGLNTQFDLSPADGWLETVRDLQAPVLATVRRADVQADLAVSAPPPPDLYLRFVHFDLAGANHWATGKFVSHPQPTRQRWTLFRPPTRAVAAYTIRRAPLADGRLLLPPGTFSVEGVDDLVGHPDLGLLRERVPTTDDDLTYRVIALPHDEDAVVDLRAMHLLSLPEGLMTEDVARLARRYAAPGGDSPMARAQAIARGLRRDYAYLRRDPTGPAPDVLHNFLFHARAGYCMHFASALAVMLRLQRIPCRIGAGLYGGRPGEQPGERVYGDADAHAWVEVPCVGRGFVVLDATPEAGRPSPTRTSATIVPEPAADGGLVGSKDHVGVPLWLLAALFLGGVVLRPLLHRSSVRAPEAAAGLPAAHPARAALARILGQLAALGVPRRRSEPLAQVAARAARELALDAGALRSAFAAYEEVRFGGAPWDDARALRMERGGAAVASATRRAP